MAETFTHCEECTATIRRPADPVPCPVCGNWLLAREQVNEPNPLLYMNWEAIFRRIPGFARCVCLRRVASPVSPQTDMDFLLLEPPPRAKLGLVETEGWNSKTDAPMKIPKGASQVNQYLREFRAYAGDGREIERLCIRRCFARNQRGFVNQYRWGSYGQWMKAIPGIRTKNDLEEVLGQASRDLVPILLYYAKRAGPRGFSAIQENALRSALHHERPYVGTVAWPFANALLSGYFLNPIPQREPSPTDPAQRPIPARDLGTKP
jgi:hypothetical protein